MVFFSAKVLTADGDFYTESPAEGSFETQNSDGNYDYKAGEFVIEAEGALPPTNERLEITSFGAEEGWREVFSGLGPEAWRFERGIVGQDNFIEEDNYYAWQPERPGLYKVNISATLTGRAEINQYYDYDNNRKDGYYFHDASLEVWKDERVVCNPSFYEDKVGITIDYDDGIYKEVWSRDCGYDFYQYSTYDGDDVLALGQNLALEPEAYGGPYDKDPAPDYNDIGEEGKETVFDFTSPAPGVNLSSDSCNDGGYFGPPECKRQNMSEKSFIAEEQIRIKNQNVEQRNDDRKDGDIIESFHFRFDGIGSQTSKGDSQDAIPLEGSARINSFEINYIDPVGNVLVGVGDRKFTGSSKSVDDYSNTIDEGSKWINTSKSFDIDLEGEFESDFDDASRLILKGEYLTDSPTGVTPEGYRWIHDETGQVIASYTNLDSSGDSKWKLKEKDIDLESNNVESGTYKLAVKSDAVYPLNLGMRNLIVKKDEYLRYNNSREYSPELKTGQNTVEIYTSNSNDLDYNYTWDECYADDLISGITPANNSYIPTRNPTLGLNTGCQTLDNVTIKNAESDVAIESYENVNEGTRLETQIDVPLGKTYSWYVSLCDQGECYETDVYEFTTGVEPTDSTSSSTTESNSKALGMIIRDEDYNPKGKDSPPSNTALTEGYINKIEEDSNQLQQNMDTVGTSTDKTNIWHNTEAGEDSADQYAITKFRNWSINNRGEPFPPATSSQTQHSTFYRDTTERRTSIDDSSVSKAEKVFANSIPVIARETITKNGETIAYPGQGVWIDPDDIDKTRNGEPYDLQSKPWESLMDFNMDITGPDSGIAYNTGPGTPLQTTEPNVYTGDIHFKRNQT